MYQKDYILRMIEMIGQFIAAILGLIKGGKMEQAQQMLDEAYTTVLKEEAVFFTRIPKEELTEKLIQEHNYTNGHLEILAELFNVEAELEFRRKHHERALELYIKSLILFEFVEQENKSFSLDKQQKMNNIRERISQLQQY